MMRDVLMCRTPSFSTLLALVLLVPSATLLSHPAHAGDVTFDNIAAGDGAGISYRRVPSKTNAIYERLQREPLYTMAMVVATPEKPRGAPGIALLDYDRDGDLDVYVTNGPGAANSLYKNLLLERGALSFEDVGLEAGVGATEQDSTGVCFGDLDNDGDDDLLVLGRSEPNRLFENLAADRSATPFGNGGAAGSADPKEPAFREVTGPSGLGSDDFGHASCSMGDVNGDGLLDIVIANTYEWSQRAAIMSEPFRLNQANQLYLNRGGLRFQDVSDSSGIRHLEGFVPPQKEDVATITWGIAMVDYDGDGDLDIIHTDDQGAIPPSQVSRGMIQVLQNDGTGHFTAVTHEVGTDPPGSLWMGLSFADLNCDGHLDLFATNMGDYAFSAIGLPFKQGQLSSRWFLGRDDGTFAPAEFGALRATVFGWGVVTPDYDNDGDPDVAFYGSLNGTMNTITADNPGTILENRGCGAAFDLDYDALAATDHARRNIHGVATGDLNLDGFPDLVSVSAFDIPKDVPLHAYPADYDSPFDRRARYVELFAPAGNGAFIWNGYHFTNGTLAVEINSADDGNGWVAVKTLGTAGLLTGGRVNRDGIGALVRVTPEGGKTAMHPVTAGSSYASENSLELTFGLGPAETATVEVLWPGGERTRVEGVHRGERIVVPEIPCNGLSAGRTGAAQTADPACVAHALDRLVRAGVLPAADADRLRPESSSFGVPGSTASPKKEAPQASGSR